MIYRILFLWLVLFFPSTSGWTKEHVPFLGEVTSDKVSVRAGGNVNFERIDILPKGTNVIVLEEVYGWYRIQLPATAKAYIRVDYLTVVNNQIAQISGNRVNIRAGRGVDSSTLGQLKKGDHVRLVSKMDDWFQIEPVEGLYGWISKDFVKVKSRTIPSLESLGLARPTDALSQKPEQQTLKVSSASIAVNGVIEGISSGSVPANVKYQITADDKAVYYLQTDHSLIANFVRRTVHLEGNPVSGDASLMRPVILVKKFNLIL